jgi:hypothetical protein
MFSGLGAVSDSSAHKTPASGHVRAWPWLASSSGMLSAVLVKHVRGWLRCPANYSYCSTVWSLVNMRTFRIRRATPPPQVSPALPP